MQSKLAKLVRKEFEARLKKVLPQFLPEVGKEMPVGGRLFRWQLSQDLSAFLFLQMSRFDAFNVEGAWSRDGVFPINLLPRRPVNLPQYGISCDESDGRQFRFRLAALWQPRMDYWWELLPEPSLQDLQRKADRLLQGGFNDSPIDVSLQKVETLVDDAVSKITEYAVPYFIETARSLTLTESTRIVD